jgi:hypothetical protein
MLIGGRGTGKTTILKCLAYEGQFALAQRVASSIATWQFYGLYYRVNTNRVNAFAGPELDESSWIRHFAHYINLEFCDLLLQFLLWFRTHNPDSADLGPSACRSVALSLNLPSVENSRDLMDQVLEARIRFEATLNNIADEGTVPGLSMQGAPVDLLVAKIRSLPQFRNKIFYFLVDEYENFLPYQQQVLNTFIKHTAVSQGYTFKIGIRELGLRRRTTLNPDELLISPADYVLISITEKLGSRFPDFAEQVCNERLKHLRADGLSSIEIRPLLPELSERDEALLLGAAEHVAKARDLLELEATSVQMRAFDALDPLFAYFLIFWASSQDRRLVSVVDEYLASPKQWEQRFGNYSHPILYTLNRGKRGIRKYYAGWSVFARLAAGNIRYLLELVDTTLMAHLRKGEADEIASWLGASVPSYGREP